MKPIEQYIWENEKDEGEGEEEREPNHVLQINKKSDFFSLARNWFVGCGSGRRHRRRLSY